MPLRLRSLHDILRQQGLEGPSATPLVLLTMQINERSLLIGGVLAVAVLFSLATNLAKASTIAIHVEDDKDLKRLLNPVQWSAHLGSALTDILCVPRCSDAAEQRSISALLTIRLLRLSAGGFGFAHSTDTIVRRIIAYSMSSAVLTAGAAVALLVCAAQSGQAFWIMCVAERDRRC